MLTRNQLGSYRFAPDIKPYSLGAVAEEGFEVIRTIFREPRPFESGFDEALASIAAAGRPAQALCGIELRCPRPYTLEGFIGFNDRYYGLLDRHRLLVDGVNPIARTNVAPLVEPPADPALYAFSYTVPFGDGRQRPTWVISGGGELNRAGLDRRTIVRAGETSADAMREKAACVLAAMQSRLDALGVDWDTVSAVDVYTVHDIRPFLEDTLLALAPAAARHGLRWYPARPPIEDIEFEMDLKGVRVEMYL